MKYVEEIRLFFRCPEGKGLELARVVGEAYFGDLYVGDEGE